MLGWPKSSFEYLCCCCILLSRLIATPRAIAHILWKNPNELFDQPSMNHYHLHQQSYQETAWLPIFTSPLIPTITSESFSLRACARAHTHTHTHTVFYIFSQLVWFGWFFNISHIPFLPVWTMQSLMLTSLLHVFVHTCLLCFCRYNTLLCPSPQSPLLSFYSHI